MYRVIVDDVIQARPSKLSGTPPKNISDPTCKYLMIPLVFQPFLL